MNKKMRELQTKNSSLKEKLKTADDWLGLTYKYMTPAGRSELRNGAYLAKEHFPAGTVRRIRENTGIISASLQICLMKNLLLFRKLFKNLPLKTVQKFLI